MISVKLFIFCGLILLASLAQSSASGAASQFKNTRQCIVVIANSWTASTGTARWFDRESGSRWHLRGGPVPVVLGRAGLAWGRGELDTSGFTGPLKREGDDKAPAGVFRLGTTFGYASTGKLLHSKMQYLALTKNVVAVDDPSSHYYNQLVDKTRLTKVDWHSAENMILADNRYKWGVTVMHNMPPIPGAGSSIFVHVWKNNVTATSGCTAMAEENLLRLLAWLDPAQAPLLVQLPGPIYNELQAGYGLPAVSPLSKR